MPGCAPVSSEAYVILGAGSGIGAVLAGRLAGPGVRLALHTGRNAAGLEAVADRCRAAGARVDCRTGDLADPTTAQALAALLPGLGPLSGMVFAAGYARRGTMEEAAPNALRDAFAAMPVAFLRCAQAVAPHLAEGRGRIVAITAFGAHRPRPIAFAATGPAKAAMEAQVRLLAHDLAPRGITCNAVVPGLIAKPPGAASALTPAEWAGWRNLTVTKCIYSLRMYVKPFVKRQKNDRADAEAIAEAALRPTMRFVAVKSAVTQGRAVAFRTHQCLVRQRTQLINALRGHLAEFGLVAPKGPASLKVLEHVLEDQAIDLPGPAREMGAIYVKQITRLTEGVGRLAEEIEAASRTDTQLRRLCTIPGVGPVTAGAVAAFAPDLDTFDSGRNFAAWLGLVPRQRSTGGKTRLGSVEPRWGRPISAAC